MTIHITRTGLATFQDTGRPGYSDVGVPTSGAADRRSYNEACWLVDSPNTTCVEILGGLTATAVTPVVVAYTGADTDVTINGHLAPSRASLHLQAGDILNVSPARTGGYGYLATADGWQVEPVLGSTSTDTLAGLGPAPIAAPATVQTSGRVVAPRARRGGPALARIHVTRGPHADLFPDAAFETLAEMSWTIGAGSSRAGLRLESARIPHIAPNLTSLPMLDGAVQLTPSGQPIVLGPDHGTTGGYPVIGMIDPDGIDALYRLREGQRFQFTENRIAADLPVGYLLTAI